MTASNPAGERVVLPIEGMDCLDCARTIERGVARLDGVYQASVSLASAKMNVTYAPTTVDIERISARVAELGYRVGSTAAATPAAPAEPWPARMLRQPENVQTAIGALLTVAGAILEVASAPH